jgi:uncharacterized protein YdhG (YjbR/CyaY superfamily)
MHACLPAPTGKEGQLSMDDDKYRTIDEYIARFPDAVRQRLETVRSAIRAVLPDAEEKISWQMPTFYQKGNLIHFAAASKHIGIYPGAAAIAKFAPEFERLGLLYSKGAVRLPMNREMPLDLVARMAAFQLSEALAAQDVNRR